MKTVTINISVLSLLCTLLASASLNAREISDIKVPERIEMRQQPLTLNGAGVRSKMFFDLYVASLYLPTKVKDFDSVLQAPKAVVNLVIISGMITAEKMRDATLKGFESATNGNIGPIKGSIDNFLSLFDNEIVIGDKFTFVADKSLGVTAFKNDKKLASIADDEFRKALLGIWIGENAVQNSLKNALLGQD